MGSVFARESSVTIRLKGELAARAVKALAEFGGEGDKDDSLPVDLAVEPLAERFIDSVQKLTYFFITASVAIIALELKFMTDNLKVGGRVVFEGIESPFLIGSIAAGCFVAGLSIQSIRLSFASSRLNLDYLYARRRLNDLTEHERIAWDRLNKWARLTRSAALLVLILQVFLGLGFLVAFILRDSCFGARLHHYRSVRTDYVDSEEFGDCWSIETAQHDRDSLWDSARWGSRRNASPPGDSRNGRA